MMRTPRLALLSLLSPLSPLSMGVLMLAALSAPPSRAQAAEPEQARVIVKYKLALPATRGGAQAATLGKRLGMTLTTGPMLTERVHVLQARGINSAALAQRLSAQSDVEYAVPDQLRRHFAAPNDPRYAAGQVSATPTVGQWYLRAPAGAVRSAIDVEPAWDITTGSSSVVVAVLDTGVRYDHNDLKAVAEGGNLLSGFDMVSDTAISNDGNGRDSDPSDPGDWVSSQEASEGRFAGCSQVSSWHGTQTASLIGALTHNGVGMASVGRTVRVLPVRVLGKCAGYDSDIIAGMRWAAGLPVLGLPDNPPANRARVINLSLGGAGACSQAYQDAVNDVMALNVVVVAAAGNTEGHAVSTPANCTGVIAVSGLRHTGTKVGFSDVGPEVALSAPAGNCVTPGNYPCLYPIVTATNSGTQSPVPGGSVYTDSYDAAVGTSFSAPLVAGTVGLMLSAQPSLTPLQVRQLLQASARGFPALGAHETTAVCTAPRYAADGSAVDQDECSCTQSTCGAGMLDAAAAVQRAASGVWAPGVRARIDVSPLAVAVGQAATLSASRSLLDTGRTISSYQWTLVSGGGVVSSITHPNAQDASVTPAAAGSFTVRLQVTDSGGDSSTIEATLVAVATTPAAPTPAPKSGGGAVSHACLVGLALAVLALRRQRLRAC